MKSVAWGLLITFLSLILIMPIVEMANVMREKILIGAALTNACRAARDLSLQYEDHRNIDAVLDVDEFVQHFARSFEDALGLTAIDVSGTTLEFSSVSGAFNNITVNLSFNAGTGSDQRAFTVVRMTAQTPYKFKTKLMQLTESATGIEYEMRSERLLLVQIVN